MHNSNIHKLHVEHGKYNRVVSPSERKKLTDKKNHHDVGRHSTDMMHQDDIGYASVFGAEWDEMMNMNTMGRKECLWRLRYYSFDAYDWRVLCVSTRKQIVTARC
jgi:hypothetical protein